MLTMSQQYTIKTLHDQGKTNADIARTLDCHRHTVENILKRPEVVDKQTRHKPSAVTPYLTQLQDWSQKKYTKQRMWEMLKEKYAITFTYDALQKFVQKYVTRPEAFGVEEHLPGEELEVDFGEIPVTLLEDNRRVKLQVLTFVLPCSGKKYYQICPNQKLDTFCRGIESALAFFGGVPKVVKVDNLKSAIITNCRHELDFNPGFWELAHHYGFIIRACTPYSPEQKGTVERGVHYVQGNFAPGRTFQNLSDVERQLSSWITVVNQKIHGTHREVINDRFERLEKPQLQSLPAEPFTFFNRSDRQVGVNCHLHLENNYYSAPAAYVGKTVTVRWNQKVVRIISEGVEIAFHALITGGVGKYSTQRSHLPEHKIYSQTEFQHYHEQKMRAIGHEAGEYFGALLTARPGYYCQTLRPIYGLTEEYGAEAVNRALSRALSFRAFDIPTIKHILEQKLYQVPDMGVGDGKAIEFTDTGNSRDLAYYT
jgi:transposase